MKGIGEWISGHASNYFKIVETGDIARIGIDETIANFTDDKGTRDVLKLLHGIYMRQTITVIPEGFAR